MLMAGIYATDISEAADLVAVLQSRDSCWAVWRHLTDDGERVYIAGSGGPIRHRRRCLLGVTLRD